MTRRAVPFRTRAALADLEDNYRGVLRVSASPVVARRYVKRIRAP